MGKTLHLFFLGPSLGKKMAPFLTEKILSVRKKKKADVFLERVGPALQSWGISEGIALTRKTSQEENRRHTQCSSLAPSM